MNSTTVLNPLEVPLWGSALIEASAGTGKTWTIAALYLRLILGHGSETVSRRPLQPQEILIPIARGSPMLSPGKNARLRRYFSDPPAG
jgi:ATP-dependent exoDNAse (exonuclease V) beta subunit